MLSKKDIQSYLNYGFSPLNRKSSVETILLMWIFALICSIGSSILMIIIVLANVLITALLSLLIIKKSEEQKTRFLFDAITSIYMCCVLMMGLFRYLSLFNMINSAFIIICISTILVCMILSVILSYALVRKGFFSKEHKAHSGLFLTPFLGAGIGYASARIFLKGASQNIAITVILIAILLMSLLLCVVGAIDLLKLYFCYKMKS